MALQKMEESSDLKKFRGIHRDFIAIYRDFGVFYGDFIVTNMFFLGVIDTDFIAFFK